MNEPDAIWNRLMNFHLNCAQNQSIVENRLPFGMKRQLTPLRFSRQLLNMNQVINKKLTVEIKDPWMSLNRYGILKPKPLYDQVNNSNKIKFIPHRIVTKCSSCSIDDSMGKALKFDPSALLFFKDDYIEVKTNLTSNANGTVSCDKNHLGAILKQGCWLISQPDLLAFPSSNLPQTMNNKLRGIKYAEFIAQEWSNLEGFGEEVEFVALSRSEPNRNTILMSKRSLEGGMSIFIIDGSDNSIKFQGNSFDLEFDGSIYERNVTVEGGDLIILMKSKEPEKIVSIICGLKCEITEDFESKLLAKLRGFYGISCLLVSRVCLNNNFDESFANERCLSYVCHLDTKIGSIVNEPKPGPFGCTTRHSVIYRQGYFAALHHDASKINRFPDTINYIIRKLCNENNLRRRLEQEGDESILKRISDIQYFAYLINCKEKILLGLGGGSKCLVITEQDGELKMKEIKIYEMSILIDLGIDLSDHVLKESHDPQDFRDSKVYHFILLSPHFPTFLIKSINANDVKSFLDELLKISGVDPFSFKVSMAHFKLESKSE